MARDRPSPYGETETALHTVARGPSHASGFPPRSFDLREKRTPAKAVSRADRGTARDRPSPYGERETALHTVARGPSDATRACERVSPAISRVPEGLARDRPSPYGYM